MSVPYEGATSGASARDEITKMLRRFGCESVGFLDDFQNYELLLAFRHRGRPMQLKASAKGWAQMYLKEHPYNYSRMRSTKQEHEQKALKQGLIAINSILRDWVKGQVMAVECGILQFEAVFMPYMISADGKTLLESLAEKTCSRRHRRDPCSPTSSRNSKRLVRKPPVSPPRYRTLKTHARSFWLRRAKPPQPLPKRVARLTLSAAMPIGRLRRRSRPSVLGARLL